MLGQIIQSVLTHIQKFSLDYGSGDLVTDTVVACLVICMVALFAALLVLLRAQSNEQKNPKFDRSDAVLGRIEKLEMAFNNFRTEMMRAAELNKGEIGSLIQEVSEIKQCLGDELKSYSAGEAENEFVPARPQTILDIGHDIPAGLDTPRGFPEKKIANLS